MPILYTTSASATGGRAGRAVSENGVLDVTLTVPKELGGDGATGTNPEQLFAAGYSACFLGALKFVAGQQKVKIPEDTTVSVKVGIGPREDGGDGATGTNPEQLFAAGYSACFLGALKFVAGQQKVKIPEDTTVSAKVGIGPREDGGGFGIEVALTVHIPGLDKAEAEKLAAAAHIVCPYSHAMRTSTEVPVTVA